MKDKLRMTSLTSALIQKKKDQDDQSVIDTERNNYNKIQTESKNTPSIKNSSDNEGKVKLVLTEEQKRLLSLNKKIKLTAEQKSLLTKIRLKQKPKSNNKSILNRNLVSQRNSQTQSNNNNRIDPDLSLNLSKFQRYSQKKPIINFEQNTNKSNALDKQEMFFKKRKLKHILPYLKFKSDFQKQKKNKPINMEESFKSNLSVSKSNNHRKTTSTQNSQVIKELKTQFNKLQDVLINLEKKKLQRNESNETIEIVDNEGIREVHHHHHHFSKNRNYSRNFNRNSIRNKQIRNYGYSRDIHRRGYDDMSERDNRPERHREDSHVEFDEKRHY